MDEHLFSRHAEAAVLGSIILDKSECESFLSKLPESYFYVLEHKLIYKAIKKLTGEGKGIDLLLLRQKLLDSGELAAAGGVDYLVKITESVPSAVNAEYYFKIIREKWQNRAIYDYARRIMDSFSEDKTANERLCMAESELMDLSRNSSDVSVVSVADWIDRVTFDSGSFIKTGFPGLDEVLYGIGEGDMIVVAGRPKSGKSCLLQNIATNISAGGVPCAVFSLEMTATQLQQRMLCSKAKVNLSDALHGRLSLGHSESIERAKRWLKEHPIYIDDSPMLTPEILRLKIIQMQSRYGIKAVFIDYLQLMRAGFVGKLYEAATEISKSIKLIANERKIPIVVAAQLNRKSEERDDGMPRSSDLRDSGSIEQDADAVILIHRPGMLEGTDTGETNIIVDRNRRGRTAVIPALFLGNYAMFVEETMAGYLKRD